MEYSTTTFYVLDTGQVILGGLQLFLIVFFGIIFYFKKQSILK